jgi:hypothetical protein
VSTRALGRRLTVLEEHTGRAALDRVRRMSDADLEAELQRRASVLALCPSYLDDLSAAASLRHPAPTTETRSKASKRA